MHHLEAAATLQQLLDAAPVGSRERYGYQAEQLGQDCARMGMGYRADVFSEPWMQARYRQGYLDALARQDVGEVTLSPLDVMAIAAQMAGYTAPSAVGQADHAITPAEHQLTVEVGAALARAAGLEPVDADAYEAQARSESYMVRQILEAHYATKRAAIKELNKRGG